VTRAIVKARPLEPINLTFDPLAVDSANAAAIEELNSLQDARLTCDEDAAEAAALLRDVVRDKDAIATMREGLLAPLKAATKAVNDLFKPALSAKIASEDKLKSLIGAYELAKLATQKALMAAASKAAAERKPEEMSAALVAAHDAAPQKLEGVSVRPKWVVKRIVAGLLLPEWLIPDEKRIHEYARRFSADQDPNGTLPGVVFELDAQISASR
jgi:hypothetical protein